MRRILAAGCALSLFATSALAQTKISQLPAASALAGTEKVAGIQGGSTVAITPAQIEAYLTSFFVQPGGALGTPSSGNAANLTGLPISTGLTGAGSGVLSALANSANASGGFAQVNGSPTSGDCLKWSGSGVQDAGAACGTGSGASWFPGYVSGNWYMPYLTGLGSGNAIAGGSITCSPLVLFGPVTVRAIGARVNTLAAGGHVQLAIYAMGANGNPTGPALVSTQDISVAAAGNVTGTMNQTLPSLQAGTYQGCINADASANGVVIMETVTSGAVWGGAIVGSTSPGVINDVSNASRFYVRATQTYGTWPDVTAASWTAAAGLFHAAIQLQAN